MYVDKIRLFRNMAMVNTLPGKYPLCSVNVKVIDKGTHGERAVPQQLIVIEKTAKQNVRAVSLKSVPILIISRKTVNGQEIR